MQATADAVGAWAQQSKCRGTRASALVHWVHGDNVERKGERTGRGIGTVEECAEYSVRDMGSLELGG